MALRGSCKGEKEKQKRVPTPCFKHQGGRAKTYPAGGRPSARRALDLCLQSSRPLPRPKEVGLRSHQAGCPLRLQHHTPRLSQHFALCKHLLAGWFNGLSTRGKSRLQTQGTGSVSLTTAPGAWHRMPSSEQRLLSTNKQVSGSPCRRSGCTEMAAQAHRLNRS